MSAWPNPNCGAGEFEVHTTRSETESVRNADNSGTAFVSGTFNSADIVNFTIVIP